MISVLITCFRVHLIFNGYLFVLLTFLFTCFGWNFRAIVRVVVVVVVVVAAAAAAAALG
jgi:hypothetical protein